MNILATIKDLAQRVEHELGLDEEPSHSDVSSHDSHEAPGDPIRVVGDFFYRGEPTSNVACEGSYRGYDFCGVHSSPVANQIRTRMSRGENPAGIQQDLAFGTMLRTARTDRANQRDQEVGSLFDHPIEGAEVRLPGDRYVSATLYEIPESTSNQAAWNVPDGKISLGIIHGGNGHYYMAAMDVHDQRELGGNRPQFGVDGPVLRVPSDSSNSSLSAIVRSSVPTSVLRYARGTVGQNVNSR